MRARRPTAIGARLSTTSLCSRRELGKGRRRPPRAQGPPRRTTFSAFGNETLNLLRERNIERLSLDLPIIVEIVDSREKLEAFLEAIDDAIVEGLATLEKAEVRFYRSRKPGADSR